VIHIGGYTAESQGIASATFRDGALTLESVERCPEKPSFLALAPGGAHLYAAHEFDDGLVSAFGFRETGALRYLGSVPAGGSAPCHLSVHPSGRFVLVANWGSGSIAVLPVEGNGRLGPATDVVEHPKTAAHMVVTDPGGRWVLAVHFGAGMVFTYDLDLVTGRLRQQHATPIHLDGNAGPRHLAFHPNGTTIYVVNEHESTVTTCSYNAERGHLETLATVGTAPDDVPSADNHPSAILVSPDGRFVYVANRGHDSVAVLATEPRLRLVATYECGGWPRDLAFVSAGQWLLVANERDDRVTVLSVDAAAGSLAVCSTYASTAPTCILPA
jgi:6-phosphogluconolactonase